MVNKRKNKQNLFSLATNRFGKLDGYSFRLNWTEDSFIAKGGHHELVGCTFDFKKLAWLKIILFLLLGVLLLRIGWLQIIKHDYYYGLAEGNRIRIERVQAKRGIIYDNKMRPLVKNVANFVLYSIPADLPQAEDRRQAIVFRVSEILGGDNTPDKITGIINQVRVGSLESYQPVFIADNIEYEKAMSLILEENKLPGIFVSNKTRREYNLISLSLSHILGYTGKINEDELKNYGSEYQLIDYIGKTGLEYFYESELRGEDGRKQIEVDALGKTKKVLNTTEAQDGHNLQLALDSDLQKEIEEVTNNYLQKTKATRAAVIAMNPNNGEILALVSLPAYNNNIFARGIKTDEYNGLINHPDRPLFDRAISGEYPSGSTIKPIMAAAALQEKIITAYTTFLSTGGIRIGQWFFPDWKAGGHGITNVKKALADSVNTFFYIVGGGYNDFVGLGLDRIVSYEKLFGLSEQTGIDLPGERSGFLPSKEWKEQVKGEPWYIGDTYHLSIGQGDILVTPLQVANYTSVFANGGSLYRPHLVKEILDSSDQPLSLIQEDPIRQDFIDPKNIEIVREGMRQTVTDGSARSLQAVPVAVAGKTGTAQWSTSKPNHAWFTGFAPYDNPQIVLTILVEEGGEGSSTAVPIAKDVLTWYFNNKTNNTQ